MHHFLALRLADGPRDRLTALSERLQAWNLPAQWVHPEDLHLTLLFLGDCDDADLAGLRYAVDDLARSLVQPRLRLVGLGAWGGKTEPKIVYAACADADGICATTHAGLAEALAVDRDVHFHPHVTVARPRGGNAAGPARGTWPDVLAAHGEADWGDCPTTHLVLYRSTARVPRYEALESWPLAGGH